MNKNIGKILKESRISSGISVKEISDILVSKGYKASESTIYSWENENSQPTPGAFLVMCGTYGIKNVFNTFGYNGYNEDGSIQLNIREIDIIEKYRFISTHSPDGASVVDAVLDREYVIAEKLKEQVEKVIELTEDLRHAKEEAPDYLLPKAARNDYENEPGELERMQKDIANLKRPDSDT